VNGTFQGNLNIGNDHFDFSPRIFRPYDLLRKIDKAKVSLDNFDRAISQLDQRFVAAAKSEMYRTRRGWIDKAVSEQKIRMLSIDDTQYLIPRLSKTRTVGIDTSSIDTRRLIGIFIVPDENAGASLFDKHLQLPKTHNHAEWKWSKLNDSYRDTVLKEFNIVLEVCCEAALLIDTDLLSSGKGHVKDKLTYLVEGCFSGYERLFGEKRKQLRSLFYSLINNTPVHCDSDFTPVTPEDVVRTLVRQLAKTDSGFNQFTPLNVPLRSHESTSIQIADILVGAIKELKVQGRSIQPFEDLWFDKRKIRSWESSSAKPAYFVNKEVSRRAQPTV
jgi:hypothetical protein